MRVISYLAAVALVFLGSNAIAEEFRFDHAVLVVSDVKAASRTYTSLGFTLKPGRLHDNGLFNSFIQFADSTELELMSVIGEAKDDMAKGYAELLAEKGESGAYIALTGPDLAAASNLLKSMNIDHDLTRGQLWDFLTFPENSGLEHFFLIKMHREFKDSEELYKHNNRVDGIKTVWVEGSTPVRELLTAFGGKRCSESSETILFSGTNFVLVPPEGSPRLRFLGLGLETHTASFVSVENAHGIWLDQRNVECQ